MSSNIAKITDVGASIDSWRGDLSKVMASDVDPEKFVAAVTTALTLNPEIVQKCTAESIKNACIKAAYDGLRPDGKEGALVAYGAEAQWMPMVYGIRKKARDHDGIIITAEVVYEKDSFLVIKGDDDRIEHEPAPPDVDPGKVVASYAIFKKGGEILHREVMRLVDINAIRNASKSKNSPAWNNWFGEMAKKGAVNRGAKSVPMSDAVLRVIQRDNDHYDLMRDVTPAAPNLADRYRPRGDGFSADHVRQLDNNNSGAQPDAKASTTSPGRTASAVPAEDSAGGTGSTATGGSRSHETPSSSAPSSPRDDGTGGDAEPPTRVSAETFRDYHSALARYDTKDNVEKAHKAFWTGKGIKLAHPDDMQLAKDIHDNHVLRAEGTLKMTPAELAKTIDGWIQTVTGGAL